MIKSEWRSFEKYISQVAKENNIKVDDIFVCTEKTPFSPENVSGYHHFYHTKVASYRLDTVFLRHCSICGYDIDSGRKVVHGNGIC